MGRHGNFALCPQSHLLYRLFWQVLRVLPPSPGNTVSTPISQYHDTLQELRPSALLRLPISSSEESVSESSAPLTDTYRRSGQQDSRLGLVEQLFVPAPRALRARDSMLARNFRGGEGKG